MRISSSVLIAVAVCLLSNSVLAQASFGQFLRGSHFEIPEEWTEFGKLSIADQDTFIALELKHHADVEKKQASGKYPFFSEVNFLEARKENGIGGITYLYLKANYLTDADTYRSFILLFKTKGDTSKLFSASPVSE